VVEVADRAAEAVPPTVPQRFVNAVEGDCTAAAVRWEATLRWRDHNRIDTILERPQPDFRKINESYAACFHNTDREGRVLTYVLGTHAAGCKLASLVDEPSGSVAWVDRILLQEAFLAEYQWWVHTYT
jgi:hypothetical protein